MKSIVIIGAGQLGKEVVWLIEDINRIKPTYLILGFLDDDIKKHDKEFSGYRVLGGIDKLDELNGKMPICAAVALKSGAERRQIVEAHPDFTHWETIIHPHTVVASSSVIGAGSILFPNVTVSVDSRLGCFGVYNIQATIGSDCRVGDYITVMFGSSVLEHSEVADEVLLPPLTCIPSGSRIEHGDIAEKEQEG